MSSQALHAPVATFWWEQPLQGPSGQPAPACSMSFWISTGVSAPPITWAPPPRGAVKVGALFGAALAATGAGAA